MAWIIVHHDTLWTVAKIKRAEYFVIYWYITSLLCWFRASTTAKKKNFLPSEWKSTWAQFLKRWAENFPLPPLNVKFYLFIFPKTRMWLMLCLIGMLTALNACTHTVYNTNTSVLCFDWNGCLEYLCIRNHPSPLDILRELDTLIQTASLSQWPLAVLQQRPRTAFAGVRNFLTGHLKLQTGYDFLLWISNAKKHFKCEWHHPRGKSMSWADSRARKHFWLDWTIFIHSGERVLFSSPVSSSSNASILGPHVQEPFYILTQLRLGITEIKCL